MAGFMAHRVPQTSNYTKMWSRQDRNLDVMGLKLQNRMLLPVDTK